MRLTIRQFVAFLDEMAVIIKLETGSGSVTQPRGLTGEAAHRTAMRMFGKKENK